MKIFIIFLLLFLGNPFMALSACPPAHLVERKMDNPQSKIEYKGLIYYLDRTMFNDEYSYQLSKTYFIEYEISHHPYKIICAYGAFSQSGRKWGDILLVAYYR